ncbi:hypothetical protein SEA_RIZWANA_48 [Arthrobacter phage Rizwana]|nr:hypothetical protein SEA_RIZWANA_48 [Arthrobacter phage Rizwana]
MHIGRHFKGTLLEDVCPCGKAPCGLVDWNKINPECIQHSFSANKTIRQGHTAENCPGGTHAQAAV